LIDGNGIEFRISSGDGGGVSVGCGGVSVGCSSTEGCIEIVGVENGNGRKVVGGERFSTSRKPVDTGGCVGGIGVGVGVGVGVGLANTGEDGSGGSVWKLCGEFV